MLIRRLRLMVEGLRLVVVELVVALVLGRMLIVGAPEGADGGGVG